MLSQAIASFSSSSTTAVIWGRCFLSSWQQALHILRNLLRKWLVAGIIGGTLKEPHTFCMIWTPSSPGHTLLCPNNSMYRHPRAYTSTAGPLCAVLNISGAMYGNVPVGPFDTVVTDVWEACLNFEIPMSQMRTSCRSSLTYEYGKCV